MKTPGLRMSGKSVWLSAMAFFLATGSLFAQTGVTIGSNTPPDPSAVLDLTSTTKGFLVPRMTTTQRNAIVNPSNGLSLYNTTTNCLQVYFPLTGWRNMACDCQTPPVSTFTYSPNTPNTNANVTFTPTTPGMNYSWTFQSGNPATSASQSPVVQWSSPGTYQVTLTVTDNAGCNSTTTVSVTVTNCSYNPGSQTFNINGSGPTGSIQTFTVPPCITSITVDCRGAQGGGGGGNGARMIGTFTVTPSEQIKVLVGQQGGLGGNQTGNGGGGGSFVTRNNNTPMIIAGGGGGTGHNNSGTNYTLIGGTTNNNGQDGQYAMAGLGGTGGNGGAVGFCNSCGANGNAGGGGGLLTNGGGANGVSGGSSFAGGGTGGNSTGGFGGGGGGYIFIYGCGNPNHGGSGGGGYSGGGGGGDNCNGAGGGGGSFNSGTNTSGTSAYQSGNGIVIITW